MNAPLLSLSAAAAHVGMKGAPEARARRLMRYLMAVQARDGVKILVASGGAGSGRRYRVALEALRESVPELFSRRDELLEAVRQELADVRERLEDVSDRGDLIADHLVELATRVNAIEAGA